MAIRTLSLCTGGGGLELGLRLAVDHRVVCYVEREAYAASLLVERIEEGYLDEAPIWSDLRTFDPEPWRGRVDLITGGYPCQPFSAAGKRAGESDPRHLWPVIAEIVRVVEPRLCFFENVDGHITLGYEQVREELEGMGYRVTEEIVSAQETTAPHLRKRLFIMADRLRDGPQGVGEPEPGLVSSPCGDKPDGCDQAVADAEQQSERESRHVERGPKPREDSRTTTSERGGAVVLPGDPDRRQIRPGGDGEEQGLDLHRQGPGGVGEPDEVLADASHDHGRRGVDRPEAGVGSDGIGRRGSASSEPAVVLPDDPERRQTRPGGDGPQQGLDPDRQGPGGPGEPDEVLADASGDDERRRDIRDVRQASEATKGEAYQRERSGSPAWSGVNPVYPPGPQQYDAWRGVDPSLLPALPRLGLLRASEELASEPEFRGVVDGLAAWLESAWENRTERLQLLGNGVTPLAAALGWTLCERRMSDGDTTATPR